MNRVRCALLALARAGEKLLDQPLDDLPLRGIGVLRLVDQHMVDLAIELVAHPVAHSRLRQQPAGPIDQIVEVGDSGSALGAGVGRGERLARAKPAAMSAASLRPVLDVQQFADQDREPARPAIHNAARPWSGRERPERPFSHTTLRSSRQRRRPFDGRRAQATPR